MTESAEHKVDRTGWGTGPWDNEPDREEWRAHGLPCLVVRNSSGALCGYVGVPPGHRFHGVADSEIPYDQANCHGGLTYSGLCAGHICHVARPGEPEAVWWLGFDCNHYVDVAPGHVAFMRTQHGYPDIAHSLSDGSSYRTIGYVRRQVERLAEQLAAVSP